MFEFLAVDLGATSGRVAIGQVGSDSISLDIVHRFLHEVIPQEDGSLLWNWDLILTEVLTGLKEAIKTSDPISLAVDSWAVDFGFISPTGQYLPPVHAYRDPRNEIAYHELTKRIGKERIYSTTGIQFLPFNTIYQLYASRSLPEYEEASNFLMLPDLVNFLLTQKISTEVTNASSTQVLNTRTREWDRDLIKLAGIREDLFTDLHEPGSLIGVVRGFDVLDGINVVATASHDTAAAIAGIPFNNRETEAYISSGTWSLVGVELDEPVLTPDAFAANITNELGVDGTVRALKNVTGMWILEECRRTWLLEGRKYEMPKVLELAFASRTFATLIDPNEPDFAHPGGMPQRIYAYCIERGLTPPQSDGELAFCILNSLAHAYKKTIDEISIVTGRTIELIHILGGGSQIDLLNQLTADICKVRVKTGPIEATLFGNIAVQAIAAGTVADLKAARSLIRNSFTSKEFQPSN
jgi:rhamnulokinase